MKVYYSHPKWMYNTVEEENAPTVEERLCKATAIQIGFFRRKYYYRECYVKVKGC